MTGEHHDEFHVGYADGMPPGLARFVRGAVVGLLLLAAALGAGLALLLERFDEGVFEYGTVRDYEGELLVDPHPRLLVADGPAQGYLLVGLGKHGLDLNGAPGTPAPSDEIRLSATLIRNPEAAMLEVHSLELPEGRTRAGPSAESVSPGESETGASAPIPADAQTRDPDVRVAARGHTVVGEIVDTKCYLGAMKPGRGKPHRDCASLCIRGGIPAALLVRTESGERRLVHLLDQRGQPLGHEVLEWVGEPVEVTGSLRRRDNRLLLRTSSIRPTRAPAPSFAIPDPADTPPTGSSR